MAWTQSDIDTLKAAIATGAKKVTFGAGPDQRTVEYRSLEEMERTLSKIEAEVCQSKTPMTSYIAHDRG
jgi:hypothetical protein